MAFFFHYGWNKNDIIIQFPEYLKLVQPCSAVCQLPKNSGWGLRRLLNILNRVKSSRIAMFDLQIKKSHLSFIESDVRCVVENIGK
ncbi:CLUMA_CG012832, isoform A [Clunio marinus]|uniref:CLUMA_CG012832, isoform A n=1 Tax=Clunio marinus TaxID=568069 RepID=A0A1J1IM19_9DIPT|nr:CLUMA_CG012832, isoform A [Clunio marinus]